jgi:hypothetical protein
VGAPRGAPPAPPPRPTNAPVLPSSTTSGTPPTLVAITGFPAAPASMSATGVPSFRLVSTTMSRAEYRVGRSSTQPVNDTRAPRSEAARRASRSRSSPSPTIAKCTPGRSRATRAAAWRNVSWSLTGTRRPTMPTTVASGGRSRAVREAAASGGAPTRESSSSPTGITRHCCGRPISRPRSSFRTDSDTATSALVHRASRRSADRKARATGGEKYPSSTWPWNVCTTTGVPARRAAYRPSAPAFARCVWTMSGRLVRTRRASSRAARTSLMGSTGRFRVPMTVAPSGGAIRPSLGASMPVTSSLS